MTIKEKVMARADEGRRYLETIVEENRRKGPRTVAEIHAGMARRRVDVWEYAFGGVFRLFLPFNLLNTLEDEHGAIGLLLDGLPEGQPQPDAAAALQPIRPVTARSATTIRAARAVIRAALTGGRVGVVNGERIAVRPEMAVELVATLDAEPLAETWRLARAAILPRLVGREATDEEAAAWTLDEQARPIIPKWARMAA